MVIKMSIVRALSYAICALLSGSLALPASAVGTKIRDICRVKGQEENVLRGLGLVVGLKGTGEAGDGPTMRALARSLELMGSPLGHGDAIDEQALEDLKKNKNVALAVVEAVVPATGARRGDKLDCHVSGLTGKSLIGGRLAFAALQGPNTQDRRVFALAQGAIHVGDPAAPLSGRIHQGCQIEQDIFNPFELNGQITLVLDKNHADFQTATEIAYAIRQYSKFASEDDDFVEAKDAANIVVQIPKDYPDGTVEFIAQILGLPVIAPSPEARVVINERSGTIVISGDVEIGSVIITHKNLVVEADANAARFVELDTAQVNAAKLKSLMEALNALKVAPEDIIEIIKGIERQGKLHGRLIIE